MDSISTPYILHMYHTVDYDPFIESQLAYNGSTSHTDPLVEIEAV